MGSRSKNEHECGNMEEKLYKEKLKALRRDMEEALAPIAKKHEVSIDLGTIHWSTKETHLKLTILGGEGRNAFEEKFRECLKTFGKDYGLDETFIGKTISESGQMLRFVGLKASRGGGIFLVLQHTNGRNKEKYFAVPIVGGKGMVFLSSLGVPLEHFFLKRIQSEF